MVAREIRENHLRNSTADSSGRNERGGSQDTELENPASGVPTLPIASGVSTLSIASGVSTLTPASSKTKVSPALCVSNILPASSVTPFSPVSRITTVSPASGLSISCVNRGITYSTSCDVTTVAPASNRTILLPASSGTTLLPASNGTIPSPARNSTILLPASSGTILLPACSGTILKPASSGTILSPTSNSTILLPASSGTTLLPASSGTILSPARNSTILLPASSGTILLPARSGTILLPASSGTILSPASSGTILLPASSGTILSPARSGTILSPASNSTILSPARSGTMLSPARSGTILSPASNSTILSPARSGTIHSPASNSTILSPARSGTILSPASNSTILSPARSGTILSPARSGTILSPARSGTILSPANNSTILSHARSGTILSPARILATRSPTVSTYTSSSPSTALGSRLIDAGFKLKCVGDSDTLLPNEDCQLLITMTNPRYEQYRLNHHRKSTYTSWPFAELMSPTYLSNCGFFCRGRHYEIACFLCGCKLRGLQGEDRVQIEHALRSPDCPRLRLQMGPCFVDLVQSLARNNDHDIIHVVVSREVRKEGSPLNIRDRLRVDPAVRAVKDIGYPIEYVLEIAQSLKVEGRPFSAIAILEKIKLERITIGIPTNPSTQRLREIIPLQTMNDEIRYQLQCKICMTNEVAAIFHPCGHLVSCELCATELENICPFCRGNIKYMVPFIFCDVSFNSELEPLSCL